MKATQEKIENRQAYLTVEMDADEVAKATEAAYRRLVVRANVPGFRKGKAPRPILERYLGKDALLEDALNHLIPEVLDQAIKEQGIEAMARPEVELVKTETPVTFKAVIALRPTVEGGDYRSLRMAKEKVETTESGVNDVLDNLRHHHATWEPVERPAQFGDMAVLSIHSTVGDKPFFNQESVQYLLREGSSSPLKGFVEQIAGMKKDDEKEFQLSFPEDYPQADLVGKEASFKVRVLETKEEKLPQLDDSLAKQINPEYETLDKLRTYVTESLTQRAEDQARIEYENRVVDAVIGVSKVEFPPVLVESEIDHLLTEQQRRLQAAGAGGLEEYMRITKKTAQQLRDDLRPAAVKSITRHLVLDKIAVDNKIEPSEEEVNQEVNAMIDGTGPKERKMAEILGTAQARHSVKHYLETKKTLDMLVKIIAGEEDKVESQEKTGEVKEGEKK